MANEHQQKLLWLINICLFCLIAVSLFKHKPCPTKAEDAQQGSTDLCIFCRWGQLDFNMIYSAEVINFCAERFLCYFSGGSRDGIMHGGLCLRG